MRFWDFIFKILMSFNLLSSEQFNELRADINDDWAKVQADPEKEGYKKNWKATLKEKERSPYFRLGLACAVLPVVKIISDWLHSTPEQEEEEEEAEEVKGFNPFNSFFSKRK